MKTMFLKTSLYRWYLIGIETFSNIDNNYINVSNIIKPTNNIQSLLHHVFFFMQHYDCVPFLQIAKLIFSHTVHFKSTTNCNSYNSITWQKPRRT